MHEKNPLAKQTLSKDEILRSKKIIQELFDSGSSFFLHPFKFVYLKVDHLDYPQILFTVSQRNFKKAVDRNKIRRRIIEAYRLNKKSLLTSENFPYCVAIIYISKNIHTFSDIQDKLKLALVRLNKTVHQ